MSGNMQALRDLHDAFNRRDWSRLISNVAEECVYVGADGAEYRGKDGFLAAAQQWVTAFSDGRITEPQYYDAGDTIISEFVGRGTHDGMLGAAPPTNREVVFPYVDVYHFDEQSHIISGRSYTDRLSILTQLGVISPDSPP